MDNMIAMHHAMLLHPPRSPRSARSSASSSAGPCSSFHAYPTNHTQSHSHSNPSRASGPSQAFMTKRPKMSKKEKSHSSSVDKQRNVQASLEAKVEKSRGWNAFFVPLARPTPGAPPSSPVLGATRGMDGMSFEGPGGCEHVEDVAFGVLPPFSAPPLFSTASSPGLSYSQDANGYTSPQSFQSAFPGSFSLPPSPSTTCERSDRSDTGLSRETTRSSYDYTNVPHQAIGDYFNSGNRTDKYARDQWVECVPGLGSSLGQARQGGMDLDE